jgi:hypothetical protein
MDTFKRFLQYVNDDAEYINLNGYKREAKYRFCGGYSYFEISN